MRAIGGAVLARLQQGLELLYRVETRLDVRSFVVNESERNQALNDNGDGGGGPARAPSPAGGNARRPREQLLVSHQDGELSLGLYLDDEALANLAAHDPRQGLGEHNFFDFCLAVEGVSHFIYVALRAAADRQVTALELELQAEVDKFVSCVLMDSDSAQRPRELRARLYQQVTFAHDLDPEERARYTTANQQAHRYARALEHRFLRPGRIGDMLHELRRFYRLSLEEKLGHIACSAG